MNAITSLLTGGFAKGYRTYILAGLAVLTSVIQFSVGDIGLTELINQVAVGAGLGALRSAVN